MVQNEDEPLFSGELLETSTGKTFPVEFLAKGNGSFIAEWPTGAKFIGAYTLRDLRLETGNLKALWVPDTEVLADVEFTIKDTPWTMPASLPAFLILLTLIGLTGLMVWLNLGPLYAATIGFAPDRQTKSPITGEVKVYKFLRTRGLSLHENELNKALTGGDLIKMEVVSVSPSREGARAAVDVTLVSRTTASGGMVETDEPAISEADEQRIPNVDEGDIVSISADKQKLTFAKGSSGFLQKSWLPMLIGLLMLAIWLAIFAYLYLHLPA
jgi:hypothetical protein